MDVLVRGVDRVIGPLAVEDPIGFIRMHGPSLAATFLRMSSDTGSALLPGAFQSRSGPPA